MASVIIIGTTPTIRFNNFQTVYPTDFRVADLIENKKIDTLYGEK